MKRGSAQLKRTPLKRKSTKKMKEERENDPHRRHYKLHKLCPVTGNPAVDCHEIPSGTGCRHLAVQDPDCWLAASRNGHAVLQGMPKAKQVALKWREVKRAVNRCRVGMPQLTNADIIREMEKLDE